jgi:hypothetical protein
MQVSTIGSDLAKNVFQVHGIDANENASSQVLAPFCSCSGCRRFLKVLMPLEGLGRRRSPMNTDTAANLPRLP